MDRRTVLPFLWAEGGLLASFLLWDLSPLPQPGVWLKYMGVLLCLAFSLECARLGGDVIVACALALTALADFLLLVDGRHALGVLAFLAVQGVHALRLRRAGRPLRLLPRAILAAIAVLCLALLGQLIPLHLLAAVYYPQLLVNAALAWTLPGGRWRLFALGLTLFACCDLCVGLSNAPALIPAPLGEAARMAVWPVYLPSQILIALSALPSKEASHENEQALHCPAGGPDCHHPGVRRHRRPHPVPPLLLRPHRPSGAGGQDRPDGGRDQNRL